MQDYDTVVAKVLNKIQHASLQHEALKEDWLQKQMPCGLGPVFSILGKRSEHSKRLPSRMYVFQHATSLGGMDSLMEWRAMRDAGCDKRLLRISCGIEEPEDLKSDLIQGMKGMETLLLDFSSVDLCENTIVLVEQKSLLFKFSFSRSRFDEWAYVCGKQLLTPFPCTIIKQH